MASYNPSEIKAGIMVVVVLTAFTALSAGVGSGTILEAFSGKRLPCVAYFEAVGSLETGAQVSVAGQREGSVTAIDLVVLSDSELRDKLPSWQSDTPAEEMGARHLVRVTFLLDANLQVDPKTAHVALAQDSLLGNKFITLYPGHWKDRAQAQSLDAQGVTSETPLIVQSRPEDSLLASVAPVVQSVNRLIDTLQTGVLSEQNLASVSSAVENLNTLLSKENVELTRATLADLQSAVAAINKELDPANEAGLRTSIAGVAKSAEDTLSKVDGPLEDAQTFFKEGTQTVKSADALLAENRESIDTLLREMAAASKRVDTLLVSLNSGIAAVQSAAVSIDDVAGDRLGEDLEETLEGVRKAAQSIRKLADTLEQDSDMLLKGRSVEEGK